MTRFDDWYVQHASFWLDLRIAFYTLIFFFTGERRFEQAVHEAARLQQTNGHAKIPQERKGAGIRAATATHHQATAKLPMRPERERTNADVRTGIAVSS